MRAVFMGDTETKKPESRDAIMALSIMSIIAAVAIPPYTGKTGPVPPEFRHMYRTQVRWKYPSKLGITAGIILGLGGVAGLMYASRSL